MFSSAIPGVATRGVDTGQFAMLSYVTRERRVPEDHPLRRLRPLVDGLLASMGTESEAA